MTLLTILARPLVRLNDILLAIGRWAGVVAVAAMVIAILIQIWFRYVLNNALPWPDEAARFCMLWMGGLMAPSAFRSGGFVAIDMLAAMLPKLVARGLTLVLLVFSLMVSVAALKLGWDGITGFGGKFATASLWVPDSLAFDAWIRVPRSWMMASLVVGFALLVLVNIELILRNLLALRTGDDPLPPVLAIAGGAE
ncbi:MULTISPECIES: TRAP transporter small permease [Thioclava]|uniref:TRAP transporter small permease protein n=1 Tax=Thioclava nitratireducens TaxID=1915078 RepID=A0ABN4X7K0_9RHOB|nr:MULTISPECIES: TRAP transporter small permease subunit [Thioclava]AQS47975.1 C4-dicarboxylate ABC transporter permease [Thioclava nitratireducens]OWY10568.1 C4-dicarboxylate ABC transporter permease [Thioclava sp. F42-5]OWY12546.1 C4-dicarboxylate ABC transporter permease [Thioclava sp. F34-6]WGT50524.1 TRAP transporter small permease subunit [Thioclava nitratireducens]